MPEEKTKEELRGLREECSVFSGEFLRLAYFINHFLLKHSIPHIWKKRYNIALLAVRPHVSPHNILFGVFRCKRAQVAFNHYDKESMEGLCLPALLSI
jgi:hypothetical protein